MTTEVVNVTAQPMSEIVHEILKPLQEPMFLQTRTAQVIAGIFVWAALFITCQQVRLYPLPVYLFKNPQNNGN